MKYSKYNYIFKSQKYGYLIYNSESNSFAELDESIYETLIESKDNDEIICNLDHHLLLDLQRAKMIVENDDNKYYYKKKLLYNLQNYNVSELGLAIAPTTFCNFSCNYCFEENRLPVFMKDDTIENLIRFIKEHKSIDKVNLEWYGGEPLAGFEIIKKILNRISNETNISLGNHSMISNGYLLDEEKSKYFSENPLNNIQITIDGNEETHNTRRKLSNGGKTFETIVANIDTFFKYNSNTRVNIRVNIDSSNYNEFIELYDKLKDRWTDNNVDIYPAFVQNYNDGCSTNCDVLNKVDIVKFYIDLSEKYNFPLNFYPSHRIGGCGATRINYYVVGPTGELYKCWNDLGVKNKIIGNIHDNKIPNENILYQYLVGPTMFEDEKCKSCEILPICNGGCQWMRIQNNTNNKNFDLCSNRKNNMDKFLELHYSIQKQSVK